MIRYFPKNIVAFLLAFSLSYSHDNKSAPFPLPPILQCNYAYATSHADLETYLAAVDSASPLAETKKIGTTIQGRNLLCVQLSDTQRSLIQKFTVLIFCQQHGNEPSGKEAATILMSEIANGSLQHLLDRIDLFVIPSMNPDGNESEKRVNARGADLNRDHLTLLQPETRALHDLYNKIHPQMTLDVHEFGAGGPSWNRLGLIKGMDEQFGAPTNLNVSPTLRRMAATQLFPFLDSSLAAKGIRFFSYVPIDGPDDTARYSTTDINDGRQSMAILHSFSFILEGRNGRSFHDDLQRRVTNQFEAMKSFLEFAFHHASEIRTLVEHEQQNLSSTVDSVILVMDHLYDGSTIGIPAKNAATGRDTTLRLLHRPTVKPILLVSRPVAYAFSQKETALLGFLDHHHIQYERLSSPRIFQGEEYTILDTAKRIWEKDTILAPQIKKQIIEKEFLADDILVPMHQLATNVIAIGLEPESMLGLIQYESFRFLRRPGIVYPVFRVTNLKR